MEGLKCLTGEYGFDIVKNHQRGRGGGARLKCRKTLNSVPELNTECTLMYRAFLPEEELRGD